MAIRLSFQKKLSLVLTIIAVMTLLSILLPLKKIITEKTRENVINQFEQTIAAFQQTQQLQIQFVRQQIQSLAKNNPQFRTVLSTASISSDDFGFSSQTDSSKSLKDANLRLNSILPSLIIDQESDLLIVTNGSGELLYSKVDMHEYGTDLSHLNIFRRTFENGENVSIWHTKPDIVNTSVLMPDDDALYLMISEPIIFGDEIHGLVIVGSKIGNASLVQLKQITDVELALYSQKKLYSTTLTKPQEKLFKEIYLQTQLQEPITQKNELIIGAEKFLYQKMPILPGRENQQSGFVIMKSLTQELAFLEVLQNIILLISLAIILFALALSYFISKSISKPVSMLSHAASQVGKGDLDTQVNIESSDEFSELGQTFNRMTTGLKERAFLKDSFERYVSKKIADEIINHPEQLKLGGVNKEISMLFTDIGGFTAMSEQLQPEQVVDCLNEYFEVLGGKIINYNGTINHFHGDTAVAFWGAPVSQPDHAELACKVALEADIGLRELKQKWQDRGLPVKGFRIGVNTGDVVVGNIGTKSRFSYSVIGDNVNLSSRLEGANKFYDTTILIAESTWQYVKDKIRAREIDSIYVKGKKQAVKIYEPIDTLVGQQDSVSEYIVHFQNGLEYYRQQQWQRAIDSFNQVLKIKTKDGPANVFIKRIQYFQQHPPEPDWNGVMELTHK